MIPAVLPIAAELTMGVLRVLAGLITGFAVLLGLLLFACGIALTLVEVVGSMREPRRTRHQEDPLGRAGIQR